MTRCMKQDCKRKLPLTAFACRCNLLFCDLHRPSDEHHCTYNYYSENKKMMEKNLSSIVYTKKETMFQSL